MTVLSECEELLSRQEDARGQAAEIKRKARARVAVLSRFARAACETAVAGEDGDALRAYTLSANINALSDGVDSVHRLLRQAVPEADAAVRQMSEVKKGAFRSLSHDVGSAVDYALPVDWACLPALRTVVQVLKDLEAIAEA